MTAIALAVPTGIVNSVGVRLVHRWSSAADEMLQVNLPSTVQAPGLARRSLADWLAPAVGVDELDTGCSRAR
jgi:hypothetical protein